MNAADVLEAARSCIGTPFVHQGRLPGVALDCAGLVIVVARDLGLEVVDRQSYGLNPSGGQLEETLGQQPDMFEIPRDEHQAGDVLLMRFTGEPQHLAIDAGATVIHSYLTVGKVCEHDLDEIWKRRIIRAYRFKGLV